MARHSAALTSLCNCLRGLPPVDVEWTSVIGLANQTLTTPALIGDQFASVLPEDVCTYIRHIYRRDVLRNKRLAGQLEEAVIAMNGQGVTPVLLKGAATLATAPVERRGVRLMSDLDIMVMPDEAERAVAALGATSAPREREVVCRAKSTAGCRNHRSASGRSRPRAPLFWCRTCPESLRPRAAGAGSVYVPTPTYRALMLIINDQFQDYCY
jgi:hypothetical protein